MRTPAEISFRLKQEFGNLLMWARPPRLRSTPQTPGELLPAIEQLRRTSFQATIVALADQIRQHRFPIFGGVIDTGSEIRWRRDYVHRVETDSVYFRRIPYLDLQHAGDHKFIWELNRHQHLVVLAQAYIFTRRAQYLGEIQAELDSWLAANPFLHGINWTSALEVAFRSLSWVWTDHLVGASFPSVFRRRLLSALYQHGCFLERNLSVYFSPNTHLLGEAVALHTLGALYPEFPRADRWRISADHLVAEEMDCQVLADGAHFEQSTYYHVYALDLFLWHDLLSETSTRYKEKLARMAEYLASLLHQAGRIPLIGDDDGGRLFHPYGERDAFGRATLATCGVRLGRQEWIRSPEDLLEQAAWWMGGPAVEVAAAGPVCVTSRLFPESGTAILAAAEAQIIVKAGGFGPGSAGHSHSDALSFVCRRGGIDLLVDSGTYTYLSDPVERNRFRGSAAHNTIRIDDRDQARPAGPFRWEESPHVRIRRWSSTPESDLLDAECTYAGFLHRRRFLFRKPDLLVIVDDIQGPVGEHLIEQFWHAGTAEDAFTRMAFSGSAEPLVFWHSRVFGTKQTAPGRRVTYRGTLPVSLAACVSFGEAPEAISMDTNTERPVLRIAFRSGSVTSMEIL